MSVHSKDLNAIEDVLNHASHVSAEPMYSQAEAAKESLLRLTVALDPVTAMLFTKDEVGLLVDAVAHLVDQTHREAAPLLHRLQAEWLRLRAEASADA